jgi:hypothetical protein
MSRNGEKNTLMNEEDYRKRFRISFRNVLI